LRREEPVHRSPLLRRQRHRSGRERFPLSGNVLDYEPRNLGDLVGRESRSGHLAITSRLTELASQVDRTGEGERPILNAASRDLT